MTQNYLEEVNSKYVQDLNREIKQSFGKNTDSAHTGEWENPL